MSDTPKLSRRKVLLGTAVAGAATAIGPDAEAAPAAPEPASDDPRRVVLKDTPHTRAYYALARNS